MSCKHEGKRNPATLKLASPQLQVCPRNPTTVLEIADFLQKWHLSPHNCTWVKVNSYHPYPANTEAHISILQMCVCVSASDLT